MDKLEIEILNGVAENLKRKRDLISKVVKPRKTIRKRWKLLNQRKMDKPSTGAEWFWDDHVFMTSAHKFEENGNKSWLLDSGATTHVATLTKNMSNLKTAINGEHVRVGNNETLRATVIGNLLLEQEGTKTKLFPENVMVVAAFACNLISVGL
jgi:hypothetical protein